MSIAKTPDPRVLIYLQFYERQLSADRSADEIARGLNYRSARKLYKDLKGWGFPVCEVCGATPTTGKHCKIERKPGRVEGKAERLPPVAAASPEFKNAILYLQSDLEQIAHHREVLKDELFVAEGLIPKERTGGSVDIPASRGARPVPAEYVVHLIAAYILTVAYTWRDIEHLLEKLHPRPADVDRAKLRELISGDGKVEGFLTTAKRIATLIRGGDASKLGPKRAAVDMFKQTQAVAIEELEEQGMSEEEIAQTMKEAFDLDQDGVREIRKLKLRMSSD